MKIDAKQAVEITSVIAVVASVLFVGVQLMLDRRVAIASQFQSRTQIVIDNQRAAFENDRYIEEQARRWEQNRPSWWTDYHEELLESGETFESIARSSLRIFMRIYSLDNNYFQFRNGLFDEGAWESSLNIIQAALSSPFSRTMYLSTRGISPETQQLFIEIDNDITSR